MGENEIMGDRLRACRKERGETLEQVGRLVNVNKSTVMRWERGDTERINLPTLQCLADHFGVSLQWLQGVTGTLTVGNPRKYGVLLPILGRVRAGVGGAVSEEIIGYETVDPSVVQSGEEYFWLRVSGDSMTPSINDGDLVLIRQQDNVDRGQYAVVLIDGEEGVVKRVEYGDGWIELHSVNPYYPPRRFEGDAMSSVRIQGLVVESRRRFI